MTELQHHHPAEKVGTMLWMRFLFIVLFITLGVSTIAFSGILHYAVAQLFQPVQDAAYSFDDSLMRAYFTAVIVNFPIFAVAFLKIQGETMHHPELRYSEDKKRLSFVILLFSFLVILTNLIAIVYTIMGGDFTAEPFLHFLIDMVIAGAIFWWMLIEFRGNGKH